jgi:hypothetical protein
VKIGQQFNDGTEYLEALRMNVARDNKDCLNPTSPTAAPPSKVEANDSAGSVLAIVFGILGGVVALGSLAALAFLAKKKGWVIYIGKKKDLRKFEPLEEDGSREELSETELDL